MTNLPTDILERRDVCPDCKRVGEFIRSRIDHCTMRLSCTRCDWDDERWDNEDETEDQEP